MDATALTLSGCTAVVDETRTVGSDRVPVNVTYGLLTSTLSFVVWFPTAVHVNASDVFLGQLGSACGRYLKARLAAYARFSTGAAAVSVDVTSLVAFASSAAGVAAVDGAVLEGVAPGTTQVSVALAATNAGVTLQSLAVVVADAVTAVTGVSVVVYTGADWVTSSISPALGGSTSPLLQLKASLTAEGDVAYAVTLRDQFNGPFIGVDWPRRELPTLPKSTALCVRPFQHRRRDSDCRCYLLSIFLLEQLGGRQHQRFYVFRRERRTCIGKRRSRRRERSCAADAGLGARCYR